MAKLIENVYTNYAEKGNTLIKISSFVHYPKLSLCIHSEKKIWKVGNLVSISSHN